MQARQARKDGFVLHGYHILNKYLQKKEINSLMLFLQNILKEHQLIQKAGSMFKCLGLKLKQKKNELLFR